MSAYTIYHSDPDNTTPIIINTGTINGPSGPRADTSINLIGRNAPGFGQPLAENFLHMLENFASPVPPTNPQVGQLWYDTSLGADNRVLRINDGSGFTGGNPAPELGGVIRSANPPTNKRVGDIWVDTTLNQLSIWNGSSFTLVGPSYSSSFQTGAYPESIKGSDGVSYLVIKNYLNGAVLTIIAQDTFRPAIVIEGFDLLYPGVNLSTKLFNGTAPLFNGVASQASSLKVTVPANQSVPANSFFRKDIPQSLSEVLTINNDGGINIGLTTSTFLIGKQSRDGVITNVADRANIKFNIYKNGSPNTILQISGDSQRVGINRSNPSYALDVNGTAGISGATNISGILTVSTGTAVGGNLTVSGGITAVGSSTLSTVSLTGINRTGSSTYIGTSARPFDAIYAVRIDATTINGIATAAQQLSGTRFIKASGQSLNTSTAFNGTQDVDLKIRLNNKSIDDQTSTSTVATSFTIGVSDTSATLYKVTKSDFLNDVTPRLVKPGFIMTSVYCPTANGALNDPPEGWLWCDGTSHPTGDIYGDLYQALTKTLPSGSPAPFGSLGTGAFNVPMIPDIVPENTATNVVVRYMIKL